MLDLLKKLGIPAGIALFISGFISLIPFFYHPTEDALNRDVVSVKQEMRALIDTNKALIVYLKKGEATHAQLQEIIDTIRETAFRDKDIILRFEYKIITFATGKQFKEWIDTNKYDFNEKITNGKIKQ